MPEIQVKDKLVTVEELGTAYNDLKTEATTSAAGLMSSADKTKLNSIEAGAEVNDVTSVNGATGAVVLDAEDVGALPLTGGMLTGDLIIRKDTPFLIMQDENGASQVQWIADTNQHKGVVVERHTGDDNLDFFYFPAPSATGVGGAYDILSTKNLASIIPTASYGQPSSFESGVTPCSYADNTVRCIQYGNGLKRITGIFDVPSDRASSGKLFTVPSQFSFAAGNNGSLQQGWGIMGRRGSNNIYPFRFAGTEFHSDCALQAGTYIVDYLYF